MNKQVFLNKVCKRDPDKLNLFTFESVGDDIKHSSKLLITCQQHYKPIELFGGVQVYENTRRNDAHKVKIAEDMGIKLITLNYTQTGKGKLETLLEEKLIS